MTPDEFAPLGMNDDEAARAHAAIRRLTKECRDVTTLYLAGTSVLIFSEGWLTWRPGYRGSLAASVVAVAGMPAAFVLWQFEMRLFAVRMVGACTNVAARWVTAQLPPAVEFQADTLAELEWPRAVVDEFGRRPETLLLSWGLSLLVITLWTFAAGGTNPSCGVRASTGSREG